MFPAAILELIRVPQKDLLLSGENTHITALEFYPIFIRLNGPYIWFQCSGFREFDIVSRNPQPWMRLRVAEHRTAEQQNIERKNFEVWNCGALTISDLI